MMRLGIRLRIFLYSHKKMSECLCLNYILDFGLRIAREKDDKTKMHSSIKFTFDQKLRIF